ncbi:ABC transporter permease [Jiangella asiatica]|uniref:ABC transporter permease n=1 Tax=Jiangella asiatica TaxID=2530372 RepID=A0A4R5D9C6_9ACTN|nr:ABC transporter permease [Jiangella asiatica]
MVSEVDATLTGPPNGQRPEPVSGTWRRFLRHPMALVGLAVIAALVAFSFLGPLVYRTDQVHADLAQSMLPPSADHPLGTTDAGYDVLGRLMVGGQASLAVGFAAALLSVIFGTLYGAVAGYLGGVVDDVMMRVVDAVLSIPPIFVLILLSAIFHPDPTVMIFIIAAFSWLGVARLVRGETLTLRTREFVQQVKMIGGGPVRCVVRHIVPNAVGTIVVKATFEVADSILVLAGLGFLGLGIQPPDTDWGGMLSNGLAYLQNGAWWLIYPPGIAIMLTVVAFNFVGDSLRDTFETRLLRR